jgi:hypothetical protein
MQYFPDGGGGIGVIETPVIAEGTAYAAGGLVVAAEGGDGNTGIGAGIEVGAGAIRVPSTWGRVKPHLGQKRAPSAPISPQWRHTGTMGARLMPYITVRETR